MNTESPPGAPPTPEERRDFYLGALATLGPRSWTVPRADRVLVTSIARSQEEDLAEVAQYFANQPRETVRAKVDGYCAPIKEILREEGIDKPFAVAVGDTVTPFGAPVLAKTRPIADRGLGVICRLEVRRHWQAVEGIDAADVPWDEKRDDKLLWRGAFTGMLGRNGPADGYPGRYHLATNPKIRASALMDIGFTQLDQARRLLPADRDAVRSLEAAPLSIARQLPYRYLLSVEGNELASGLKWMLYSNSTVIMPHPRFESWACEPFLQPHVHFVPVRDDLDDLVEVFEWCRANGQTCRRIAAAGRAFIAAMRDGPTERALMRDVVMEYVSRVDVRYDD